MRLSHLLVPLFHFVTMGLDHPGQGVLWEHSHSEVLARLDLISPVWLLGNFWMTVILYRCPSFPLNPVYSSRVGLSVLTFSLSFHRHPHISIPISFTLSIVHNKNFSLGPEVRKLEPQRIGGYIICETEDQKTGCTVPDDPYTPSLTHSGPPMWSTYWCWHHPHQIGRNN